MQAPTRSNGPARRLALATLALAAALLVPAVASAGSSNYNVLVYSQYGNSYCGTDHPELPSLALVQVVKKGPWLTVRASFDGTPAQADHAYDVFIYNGGDCESLGNAGTIVTNGFAVANVTLPRFKLPSGTASVFIAIRDESGAWHDTPIVP